MLKKHSDKKLLEGIKKGDEKSVNYLYNSFFETIKSFILSNTGTEDDAYDIFQDALMVLFKKIRQNNISESTDVKGFIFSVSKNLWYEQLRRKKKTIDPPDTYDEIDISELLDTPLEQIAQRSFLKLKPECQKVINLYIKGKDYSEIAELMSYKSAEYARRKKYLCKEALLEIIRNDPDYSG